ncbi:MAG: bifunctional diguanylate cyclase/phosphodiesterase [Methylobacteriaceae bacterium]|nr:bifunctional diguanylate cyclase/phosphodiesterase [Methylobacteriaceae bacterium]
MIASPEKTARLVRGERGTFGVGIVVCLTLFGLAAALFVSRDRANLAAAQTEAAAVVSALEDARSAFAEETRLQAERLPEAMARARVQGAGPIRLPGATETYIVDLERDLAPGAGRGAEWPAMLAAAAPLAAETGSGGALLRGPLSDRNASSPWGAPRSAIALPDGRPSFISVVPYLGAEGVRLALVGARPIDPAALAALARAADTQRLDLTLAAHVPAEDAAVRLTTTPDGQTYVLAWRPQRPGERMVENVAWLLIVFALFFAAFTLAHARRVTEEVADEEAQTFEAVGQDPLTGLPNGTLFARLLEGEIDRVKRTVNEHGAAVLHLDCDRFQEINDTCGPEVGDKLICALAHRLGNLLRASGRLARLDGDRFAIVQTDVVGPRDAEMLARRIIDALVEPFEIDERKLYVSLSIGIALCPQDADTVDELMRRADVALYRAKNDGRNRYSFFEQKLGDQLRMRKVVEDDLRTAIEAGALVLQYQPIMDISGKRMVGVESLVRWPHPVHGLISPANFIALAEECDLILPLGDWVLRRALHDMRLWPDLKVAVNVSAVQFRQKDFGETVERLLQEAGIAPERLELELTESVLLSDADAAEDAMIDLRAMGIRLALDDFGTGFSSLIYLRRFAFDKIKIDKTFLESLETAGEGAIIVHSIVHLGRALGLTVTAEGVESADQHRFLQALGCHELQGYLFSKPVSAADITRRLRAQDGGEQNHAAVA